MNTFNHDSQYIQLLMFSSLKVKQAAFLLLYSKTVGVSTKTTLSLGIKDDMMEKYGEKLTNMCGGENTGWKSQKKINGR